MLVIEIHKTNEFMHASHRGGLLPIKDIGNLLVFHFESILTNVDS